MVHVSRLIRSTPFRLALSFALAFVVTFLLSGAAVYEVMRTDLSQRLDEMISETYSIVAGSYSDGDIEDLIAAVASHSSLGDREQLFSLVDSGGKQLAGNFNAKGIAIGFSELSDRAFGIAPETSYRAFSERVGGNTLTVAFSHAETDELQAIVLVGFGWATVIVLGLAVIGGTLLATRVQHRLDAIAATMDSVSHGRLESRIPLTGKGDDIDVVSSQINAALNRLSGLVHGMRQVSNDIAHELKTPLNRLQMILEEAAHKAAPGSNLAHIDDARYEIDQINATFEAMLRIAQLEAGARRARFGPVDLNEIVGNIVEIYADVAADDHKELSLAPVVRSSPVLGDWELLTQLFANLVENAIRHTAPGTAIEITVGKEGPTAFVTVADNGPGIPIDEREKVFRRLYRMDKSRSTPGSGLGLSLVKAIADLHGAEIMLDDNHPGLRVTTRFPAPLTSHAWMSTNGTF